MMLSLPGKCTTSSTTGVLLSTYGNIGCALSWKILYYWFYSWLGLIFTYGFTNGQVQTASSIMDHMHTKHV